ncbi:MAG: signal peptidase I [Rhizobiaceae bacterium]
MTSIARAVRFVAEIAAIVFVMKSFAFASNHIPSESMVPTLEVGDRILVSKWAYGFSRHSLLVDPRTSLPGENGRLLGRLPARGDVAVFTHPLSGETMVKRVIGLPGDRVALASGRLWLNGALVARTPMGTYSYREHRGGIVTVARFTEELPGGRAHPIVERTDRGFAHTMGEIAVPPGHLFMMGDNRDNSADSRFAGMGFVPVENLQGRADLIPWSLHRCADEPGLACAKRRFLALVE